MLHRATLSQKTTEMSTDGRTHVLWKWMDGIPAVAESKLEWSAGGKQNRGQMEGDPKLWVCKKVKTEAVILWYNFKNITKNTLSEYYAWVNNAYSRSQRLFSFILLIIILTIHFYFKRLVN